MNDSLGPGHVMQPAVEFGPRLERFSRRRVGEERVGSHQVGQRQGAETAAGLPEEAPAVDARRASPHVGKPGAISRDHWWALAL